MSARLYITSGKLYILACSSMNTHCLKRVWRYQRGNQNP